MAQLGSSLMSTVTAIDHVGIAVPDFDEAGEFHRTTFGFELVHEEINEEQGVREGRLRAPGDPGTGTAVLNSTGADTSTCDVLIVNW